MAAKMTTTGTRIVRFLKKEWKKRGFGERTVKILRLQKRLPTLRL